MNTDKDFSVSALNKGAKDLGAKLTKELWQYIEAKLSKFDENITKKIVSFIHSLFGVNDMVSISSDNLKVLGDEFFDVIYNFLSENKLIEKKDSVEQEKTEKETKKKNAKKGSQSDKKTMKAADKIKIANSTETIVKNLKSSCDTFTYDDFHIPSAFNSKYVEIRGVGFLQCARFLLKNKKKFFNKQSKLLFVNGIIVAFEKFIKVSETFTGESIIDSSKKINVSTKFMTQLKIILEKLKTEYEFNGLSVCNDTPQLAVYTDYDYVYPQSDCSLYEPQVKLVTEVYNAKTQKKPLLVTLRTMTGTGKTTIAVGCAEIINYIRRSNPDDTSIFIFCCNINQVMIQAAQLAFNAGIPLAFAHIDKFVGLKITNNYNCKKETDRVLIVCAPEACYEVLKMYPDAILFLDEPTIGLDCMTEVARQNVKLITESLPEITILSSATLPEKCPAWIIDNMEIKYGSVKHVDIYSNKIHIGCEIRTLEGDLVLPHLNCQTNTDLNNIIQKITRNPFVGRAYTANVVKHIYDLLVSENIQNIPDVYKFFSDATNLSSDNIRGMAMRLLECIAACPNKIVQKLCSTKIENRKMTEIEETVTNVDDDILWETEEKFTVGHNIEYTTLGTSSAHRFLRPTLIATNEPLKFVLTNFDDLLKKFTEKFGRILAEDETTSVNTHCISAVKNILTEYEQKLAIWQKQIERFSRDKKDTSFSSENERLQAEEQIHESKPMINIDGFQINTRKHIIQFAKNTKLAIDNSAIRHEIDITPIFTSTMYIPDEYRILLACGIGIYGMFNDSEYNSFVTKFMNDGSLAYIISDASIAYGTNIPLNRVIATKDFGDTYSLNTIYQLISRAGRVGRSWIAEAFIDKDCAARIIQSIQSTDVNYNIEAINLEKIHDEIVQQNTFNDDELIIALVQKNLKEIEEKKAAEEKKRREEEEIARIAREKQQKEEEEKKKLEQLRAARKTPMVNLSSVMNNGPSQNFGLTNRDKSTNQNTFGFKRENTNTDKRTPSTNTQNKSNGFQRSGPSRLDRLSRLG